MKHSFFKEEQKAEPHAILLKTVLQIHRYIILLTFCPHVKHEVPADSDLVSGVEIYFDLVRGYKVTGSAGAWGDSFWNRGIKLNMLYLQYFDKDWRVE